MIKQIIKTLKENKNILRFVVILFILGVVFGTLFVNYISDKDKLLLINQINDYTNSIKSLSSNIFGLKSFVSAFKSNMIELLLLYVLGISIVGILLVILIIFFKGFTFGITLSSFILKYKLKGVGYSVIYSIILILPTFICYLFISFFSIYVSIKFIKAFLKKGTIDFKYFLGKYLISFLISIILITFLSLIESYLLPWILKVFTFIS